MHASLLAMLTLFGVEPDSNQRPAYLFRMSGPESASPHGQRYRPQPGDLVLFDDHSTWMRRLYHCCGTAGPLHAAIVVPREDGSLAILEAGSKAGRMVRSLDLEPRLHDFDGTILIRRLRTPLAPEQTKQLCDFAALQEGKPYAVARFLLQGTPLRPRNSLWAQHFGGTVLDRERWICSELAVAAATAAGVLDADYPANVMFPRDLCYDERYDLGRFYEPVAMWYSRPELEYVGKGVRVIPQAER